MLIGIAGKRGHGKSTVAKMIRAIDAYSRMARVFNSDNVVLEPWEHVVYNEPVPRQTIFQQRKFADKIKDMICILLSCTREQLEDPVFKESEILTMGSNKATFTPRYLMQTLGTEWGREVIHPDLWLHSTFIQYNENSNWIIDDVRFPNEVEAIDERGGILIYVDRPDFSYGSNSSSSDTHKSEVSFGNVKNFHYLVTNKGDMEELQSDVEHICKELDILSQSYYTNLKGKR